MIKTATPVRMDIGIDHPSATTLASYGYIPREVEEALTAADLNENRALLQLYSRLAGGGFTQHSMLMSYKGCMFLQHCRNIT